MPDVFVDKVYTLYHKAVGKHELLSSQEERDLLCKYHTCVCGKPFPQITNAAALTRCPSCNKPRDMNARDALIVANLRFVVRQAKTLTSNSEHLKRLISAGNVGLVMAVDRFDVSQDTRFLTYADWWIHKEMLDEIHRSSLIYVPIHKQKILHKEAKNGKYVCIHCEMRTHSVDDTMTSIPCVKGKQHQFDIPNKREDTNARNPVSLDAPSAVTKATRATAEETTITANTEDIMRGVIRAMHLSERDLFIFMAYFGIPEDDRKTEPKNLHQLAMLTGITTERVRQIKELKLKRVRSALTRQNITAGTFR